MSPSIIDTNLLVRLITYDVPHLAHKAEAMIDPLGDDVVEFPLYVLAEVVYVLAYNSNYEYSRQRINQSLDKIIGIAQFRLDRRAAEQALDIFSNSKFDFVDCLLLAESHQNHQKLLTFDKDLLKKSQSIS